MTVRLLLEEWTNANHKPWRNTLVVEGNVPLDRPGLYLAICLDTMKPYIGVSGTSLEIRIRRHITAAARSRTKISRALWKYGTSRFLWIPLLYTISRDSRFLLELEVLMIREFDTVANGYNIKASERSNLAPAGPEFSESLKRSWNDQARRERQRAIMHALREADPDFDLRKEAARKARLADPLAGYRDKLSASRRSAWADSDIRERQTAAIRDAKAEMAMDDARMSQFRERARAATLEHYAKPGAHEARSASATAAWARQPKIWITNGTANTRISLQDPIPEGWRRGRTLIVKET